VAQVEFHPCLGVGLLAGRRGIGLGKPFLLRQLRLPGLLFLLLLLEKLLLLQPLLLRLLLFLLLPFLRCLVVRDLLLAAELVDGSRVRST
jgi:hypothetical protein